MVDNNHGCQNDIKEILLDGCHLNWRGAGD